MSLNIPFRLIKQSSACTRVFHSSAPRVIFYQNTNLEVRYRAYPRLTITESSLETSRHSPRSQPPKTELRLLISTLSLFCAFSLEKYTSHVHFPHPPQLVWPMSPTRSSYRKVDQRTEQIRFHSSSIWFGEDWCRYRSWTSSGRTIQGSLIFSQSIIDSGHVRLAADHQTLYRSAHCPL